MLKYEKLHQDGKARAGRLTLPRGAIETPVFMPVGTQATVKSITPANLRDIGAGIILSNAYHLYLRPGVEVVEKAGGIHRFMGWDGLVLTDSGGYQVFSLQSMRKLSEEGIEFRDHVSGDLHRLTPEDVIEIERRIGADIIMTFDECCPPEMGREEVAASTDRTHRWAARCRKVPLQDHQNLFGIVQGGMHEDLRAASARTFVEMDFPGYAIGGLSVGEKTDATYRLAELSADNLPEDKPRYLMGVGTPLDILECVERGVDMFDCVLPTRVGRNGTAFTSAGKLVVRNGRYKNDERPIDPLCDCYVCRNFSRAYLRHLINVEEMLGPHLITFHNLSFYVRMMKLVRESIAGGRFQAFKAKFISDYQSASEEENPET